MNFCRFPGFFAAGNGSFFPFPSGKFKTREMCNSTCGWLRSICRKWDIDEHDHWWCIFNSVWLESQNSKLESTKKTEFDCKCFKLFSFTFESNQFWIENYWIFWTFFAFANQLNGKFLKQTNFEQIQFDSTLVRRPNIGLMPKKWAKCHSVKFSKFFGHFL